MITKVGEKMSEKVRITILSIELLDINFKNKLDNKDDRGNFTKKRLTDINYSIIENNVIDLKVNFTLSEYDFEIKGSYMFTLELDNVDNPNEFLEKEKEELALPVYAKLSGLVSYLSDQVRPFPMIVNPGSWINK